jgi:hypothetical protein
MLSTQMAWVLLTQRSVLPIPDSDGLVIGRRDDPGKFMVEENGAHVVQVTVQGKQTPPSLGAPDFDLVVVASRNKQGLGRVEIDSSNGSVVLFESVNERSHAVIPQLDGRGVKGDENPWPGGGSALMLGRV